MDVKSNTDKVCIIGAGSSGLTAAKTLSKRGTEASLKSEPHPAGTRLAPTRLWHEPPRFGPLWADVIEPGLPAAYMCAAPRTPRGMALQPMETRQ